MLMTYKQQLAISTYFMLFCFLCGWKPFRLCVADLPKSSPKNAKLHGKNYWSTPLQAWPVYHVAFIWKVIAVQSFWENIETSRIKNTSSKTHKHCWMLKSREKSCWWSRFNSFTVTQIKIVLIYVMVWMRCGDVSQSWYPGYRIVISYGHY